MIKPMLPTATRKQLNRVLVFTGSYLLVAAVFIVGSGNHEFLLYLVVMMVITGAVLGVYRRAGLNRGILWGFSLWGVAHMAGGLVPIPEQWHAPETTGVVYNWRIIPGILKYDQVVHGYGVGLVAWLCYRGLAKRVRSHDGGPLRPTFGILGVCAAAGMGFGALNEVIEFFAVLILPQTNVGDYRNTGWDLVANLIGALIAVTAIRLVWIRSDRGSIAGR